MKVLGIDPGVSGAFVLIEDGNIVECHSMPTVVEQKNKSVSFVGVQTLLLSIGLGVNVFLERAAPMAMGSKAAFNYGRGFEAIVLAVGLLKMPLTLIEPSKWTKEMHEGISQDLKPKARSKIAAERLFPIQIEKLPKLPKGGVHEGMIDALLIAGYGVRRLNGQKL